MTTEPTDTHPIDPGIQILVSYLLTCGYEVTSSCDGVTRAKAWEELIASGGELNASYQCNSCSKFVSMATLRCGCEGRIWCRRCGNPDKASLRALLRPESHGCSCAEPDHRIGDENFTTCPVVHIHVAEDDDISIVSHTILTHLQHLGVEPKKEIVQATYDPFDRSGTITIWSVTDAMLSGPIYQEERARLARLAAAQARPHA